MADNKLAFLDEPTTYTGPLTVKVSISRNEPTSAANMVVVTGIVLDSARGWRRLFARGEMTPEDAEDTAAVLMQAAARAKKSRCPKA